MSINKVNKKVELNVTKSLSRFQILFPTHRLSCDCVTGDPMIVRWDSRDWLGG